MKNKTTDSWDAVQREERLYQAWDDGAAAVLRDGAATARLHRRLQAQAAAREELTGFDLWVAPMLYGHRPQH